VEEPLLSDVRTFNTPLEAGLRALFMLAAANRRAFDTQRLVYYDYMLIHSGDVEGPESLHPQTPDQSGELLVRRRLLQDGLDLMRSRELVERRFQTSGIVYAATTVGRHVAGQFESHYAAMLRDRADWVIATYSDYSDKKLRELLGPQVHVGDEELISDLQPDRPSTDA
jgi:hypothetical protein